MVIKSVSSNTAQINRNGITDKTKNGCLKFQKCRTKTVNISITQIPNAFSKSVIELFISLTSQAYSNSTQGTSGEYFSKALSITGAIVQRLVSLVLYAQTFKINLLSE